MDLKQLIDDEMANYFDGGYTKASDARDSLERFAAYLTRKTPLPDDQLRRVMVAVPVYGDDQDHAHMIRMGRAVERAHGMGKA